VPDAVFPVHFSIEGPGEIVATDNGNAADMTPFPSLIRNTFSGKCLAIVRSQPGHPGNIVLKAVSPGLKEAEINIACTK
jgi:beta-galactosidase